MGDVVRRYVGGAARFVDGQWRPAGLIAECCLTPVQLQSEIFPRLSRVFPEQFLLTWRCRRSILAPRPIAHNLFQVDDVSCHGRRTLSSLSVAARTQPQQNTLYCNRIAKETKGYYQSLICRKRSGDTVKIEAERSRRRRRQGRREWGRGIPLPSRLGIWGSIVSSPNVVRSGASAENEFSVHFELIFTAETQQ